MKWNVPSILNFRMIWPFEEIILNEKESHVRDITLPRQVHIVKAMVFPVVMYRCESWTIKKAECQRTDAFELWFWKRLLRVPWTARSSNQSILKQINPEYSLEGLMLKLKLQYFGHLISRANSLEKALMQRQMGAIVWQSHLTQGLYFFFSPQ